MLLCDPPIHAVRAAVALALSEDLTPLGDLTSAVLPGDAAVRATIVARTAGVIAGRACVDEAFRQVDPTIACTWRVEEGASVDADSVLGDVAGALASVLTAERTALNFLGHLSGIATLTRAFVDAAGPGLRVWDTRKTTPGLRALEKAAVRAGGGVNHRGNLSDWVMFKDNHLAALGIDEAVRRARAAWPGRLVQVEADRIEQVEEALTAGADALLLDNMTPDEVRACVVVADEHALATGTKRALLEISGGITLESVRQYAATGADVVSSGSLTNSAPVLDIGLDIHTG
ncbi:MAG: carboxylating nicotinate-nucleotide diphosphorylase [Actinomycetota bacterium]|nr:carboxylating nicotinate-nucleotide diphosphorylase [Actinomycetota bacterium]